MTDMVNHPPHYASESGFECIEATAHMPFLLGNAYKYVFRHRLKYNPIEDLKKALFYLNEYHKYTFEVNKTRAAFQINMTHEGAKAMEKLRVFDKMKEYVDSLGEADAPEYTFMYRFYEYLTVATEGRAYGRILNPLIEDVKEMIASLEGEASDD